MTTPSSSSSSSSEEQQQPPATAPSFSINLQEFPPGSRVVLSGLSKAPQYNDQIGFVGAPSDPHSDRLRVKVNGKWLGLKPSNLQHVPVSAEEMSLKQLKQVVEAISNNSDKANLTGMDASELRSQIRDTLSPTQTAALLAKLNAEEEEEDDKEKKEKKKKTGAATPAAPAATASPRSPHDITPEQLASQAAMMKSMDKATLRRMNPGQFQMLTDDQIDDAIQRMEAMASNPQLFEMFQEQMKQYGGGAGMAQPPQPAPQLSQQQQQQQQQDPSKVLETMDGKQFKAMLDRVKSNPAMMRQMFQNSPMLQNQTHMTDEQLLKQLETFMNMSEEELDKMLSMMRGIQKVTEPARKAYEAADRATGGHLKRILYLLGMILLGFIAGKVFFRNNSNTTTTPVAATNEADDSLTNMVESKIQIEDEEDEFASIPTETVVGGDEDEFAGEF